jgi:redox-sensitive bicupin YhaK (pirin superfamily)
MKKIIGVYNAPGKHWVGDGFPVRSLFSYNNHGRLLSPFLMLDYAGPENFDPAPFKRGVGPHPHRGFETVTIIYKGEVDHRDSTGAGGHIGPGDVQWMTAASGIVHEEYHSPAFSEAGGELEMMQLWVNLPAKHTMASPRYQDIRDADIPEVQLPRNAGSVRVIAGDYAGNQGPAQTFTPMNVWDLQLNANGRADLTLPEGQSLAVVVMHGTVQVNDAETLRDAELAILGREGQGFFLDATTEARVLLLSGEPIDEPVVGYGPFVMNSQQEINQAINDYNSGKFGRIAN